MVHDWALKQFGWSNQLIKDTVEPERYLGVTPSFGKIATAGLYAMWSYGGWNSLNFVTEELQNPKRNLILAVCISIPLTILCYILVNVGLFGVLTKQQVIDSSAVAVQVPNDKFLKTRGLQDPIQISKALSILERSNLFETMAIEKNS